MSLHATTKTVSPFSTETWIVWLITFMSLTGTGIVFLYLNFQTKSSSEEMRQTQARVDDLFLKRLERIEDKLDQLLTNSKKSF